MVVAAEMEEQAAMEASAVLAHSVEIFRARIARRPLSQDRSPVDVVVAAATAAQAAAQAADAVVDPWVFG